MQLELLSPAKDLDSGKAAIDYGADAVYIGGPAYSARKNAHNSLENIAKLIEYAHFFKAKVYVALNTLLTDTEIPLVAEIIQTLYHLKTDALIIQDLGVLELPLPPIKLIASTQTNNINKEKIKFLETIGFSRVILERALSLKEINEIKANTSMEIECFVHGAICVGYSGMCNLSFASGGRSANRGECAQPCRNRYLIADSQGKEIINEQYLLSLKDLNLSTHLAELIEAGVTSFKIEGRLKELSYVKNITAYYRQKLDEVIKTKKLSKSSAGEIIFDFTPDPNKTFNRGYTDYFLTNHSNKLNAHTSASLGEYVGDILNSTPNSLTLNSHQKFVAGDGFCFFNKEQEIVGFNINKAQNNTIYPNAKILISPATKIYRNFDQEFDKKLKNSKTTRKINIHFTLQEVEDNLELKVTDENNNTLSLKKELTDHLQNLSPDYEKRLKEILIKLGATHYQAETINFSLQLKKFIPLSLLKNMRNEILNLLSQKRINEYQPIQIKHSKLINSKTDNENFNFNNHILNKQAEQFLKKHLNFVENTTVEKFPKIPTSQALMLSKYCPLLEFGLCLKEHPELQLPLFLISKQNRYLLKFNCQKCEVSIFEPSSKA